jgi:putative spermidine/putrescine transport system ATP-binding protein
MNEGNIVQSGSPSEIYVSPVNTFVAKFIGNYNVINIDVFNRLVHSTEMKGQDVAIRPEVLQLVPVGSDIHAQQEQWTAKGIIKDITMTGNVLRYDVEVGGTIIHVDSLHHQWGLLDKGTLVQILIPKKECIAL